VTSAVFSAVDEGHIVVIIFFVIHILNLREFVNFYGSFKTLLALEAYQTVTTLSVVV
jgi:hypothetical protein